MKRDRIIIREAVAALAAGDPPIYPRNIHNPDELGVDPFNLDERELETLIERLRETLLG